MLKIIMNVLLFPFNAISQNEIIKSLQESLFNFKVMIGVSVVIALLIFFVDVYT